MSWIGARRFTSMRAVDLLRLEVLHAAARRAARRSPPARPPRPPRVGEPAAPSRSARSADKHLRALAEARAQLLELLLAAAGQEHVRTAVMQGAGDRPADAAGRTGHEHSGSRELHAREAIQAEAYPRPMLRAPIRLGLQIPNFNFPGVSEEDLFERLSDIATTAESSGFDTVLVMDHLHQIRGVGPPENWMLEGNTILAALAARTTRVNLSLLVGGVTYRNPALHAKITTTLDVISGGRAIHGIGAGWNEEEATAYGYDFPPLRRALRAARGRAQHRARHVHPGARDLRGQAPQRPRARFNNPKPIRGDIPIMIGGSGEKKTLRMVAQYADASNFFGDVERIKHLLGVLEGHCERLGRDPAEITKTRLGTVIIAPTQEQADGIFKFVAEATGAPADRLATWIVGDPDTVAERCSELLDAGLDGADLQLAADARPRVGPADWEDARAAMLGRP